jgi:hypothetical protein
VSEVVNQLSALTVVALFIERATELVLTPWRAPASRLLEMALDRASAETQAEYFGWLDIVFTGMVLSGGADGMHKLTSLMGDALETGRSRLDPGAPAAPRPAATAPAPPPAPTSAPAAHVHDPGA